MPQISAYSDTKIFICFLSKEDKIIPATQTLLVFSSLFPSNVSIPSFLDVG